MIIADKERLMLISTTLNGLLASGMFTVETVRDALPLSLDLTDEMVVECRKTNGRDYKPAGVDKGDNL